MRFFRIPSFSGIEAHRDDADRGTLRICEGCLPSGPGGLRSGPVWEEMGEVTLYSSDTANHFTGADGQGSSVLFASRNEIVHDVWVLPADDKTLFESGSNKTLGANYAISAPSAFSSAPAYLSTVGNRQVATGDGSGNAVFMGKGPPLALDSGAVPDYGVDSAATGVIEITGQYPTPSTSYSETITITSTDGTAITYKAKGSSGFGDNEFGIGSDPSPNTIDQIADGLEQCIEHANGHDGKILVNRDGAVASAATITITGQPVADQTITLISSDSESLTYTAKGSSGFGDRFFGIGAPPPGSVNTNPVIAQELKRAIEHVNGHNGKILVSQTDAVLTLTQATAGPAGDTSITSNLTNVTVVNFAGGLTGGILELTQATSGGTGNVDFTSTLSTATLTNFSGGYTGTDTIYHLEHTAFPNCTMFVVGPNKALYAAGDPANPLTVYVSEPAGLTVPEKDSPYADGAISSVDILMSDGGNITALSTMGNSVVAHTNAGAHLLLPPSPDQDDSGYRVAQAPSTVTSASVNHNVASGENGTQNFFLAHDGQIYADKASTPGGEGKEEYADPKQASWKAKGRWDVEHPDDLSNSFSAHEPEIGQYWVFLESEGEYASFVSGGSVTGEVTGNLQAPGSDQSPTGLSAAYTTIAPTISQSSSSMAAAVLTAPLVAQSPSALAALQYPDTQHSPTSMAAVQLNPVTRQSDLLAWWKMDEATGTTTLQSIAGTTGADITLNGLSWVTGTINVAGLSNAGSSVNNGLASFDPYSSTPTVYSVGAWFNINTYNNNLWFIVSVYSTGTPIFKLDHWGTDLTFTHYTSSSTATVVTGTPDASAWIHVMATWNGGTGNLNLYVNGALASASSGSNPTTGVSTIEAGVTDQLTLGLLGDAYAGASTTFYGVVDDLRWYGVELSSSNVAAIYGSGSGDWA